MAYGSGAGGSLGHYSYANTATLADYTAAVQAGRKPVTGIQQADALQALRDRVVVDVLPSLKKGDSYGEVALASVGSCPETAQGDGLVIAAKLHAGAFTAANQPMLPQLITHNSHLRC